MGKEFEVVHTLDEAYEIVGARPEDFTALEKLGITVKDKIVLVRIDREAKFNNMVDIIDELDLASLTRFSLQTLTPQEKKEVESL